MSDLKFGFTGSSDFLQRLSVSLGQWWYIFFAALGSAVVSVSSSFAGGYDLIEKISNESGFLKCTYLLFVNPWAFILLGMAGILYGGIGTYRDQEALNAKNNELSEENRELMQLKDRVNSLAEDSESLQDKISELHVKLVKTWLKGSSRQLNLGTNDRVTIYYYVDEHFYVLARHSLNPRFAEVHRQKFSRNHGVISTAWEHKICVDVEDIPSYKADPLRYKEYMCEKYGYTEEKTEALTMKSCQYVAISIVDADSHIGVIVFESDAVGRFKPQKVSQITRYCADYQSYMVDFIVGGIEYDRSAKVAHRKARNVEQDFISEFMVGGGS